MKYDVIFDKSAVAYNTFFEGKNRLRENVKIVNSKIGLATYISENSCLQNVEIGKFCCIGANVRNYFGHHPSNTYVSIHPAFYSVSKQSGFSFTNKQLFDEHIYIEKNKKIVNRIGNDVWIGSDVLIMDGITIDDGAIIAAGAVVTKNVEAYSIVGGVPAKKIKMRFELADIELLLKFKWWERDITWIAKNANYFISIANFIQHFKDELYLHNE